MNCREVSAHFRNLFKTRRFSKILQLILKKKETKKFTKPVQYIGGFENVSTTTEQKTIKDYQIVNLLKTIILEIQYKFWRYFLYAVVYPNDKNLVVIIFFITNITILRGIENLLKKWLEHHKYAPCFYIQWRRCDFFLDGEVQGSKVFFEIKIFRTLSVEFCVIMYYNL